MFLYKNVLKLKYGVNQAYSYLTLTIYPPIFLILKKRFWTPKKGTRK